VTFRNPTRSEDDREVALWTLVEHVPDVGERVAIHLEVFRPDKEGAQAEEHLLVLAGRASISRDRRVTAR